MFFIKIYIKESYINYYDTSIQMCGQYCILAQKWKNKKNKKITQSKSPIENSKLFYMYAAFLL